MNRLFDCEASLACIKPRNNSNVSDEELRDHSALMMAIKSHHRRLRNWDFEYGPMVERLMIQLETLTDKIIQLDRARNRRR